MVTTKSLKLGALALLLVAAFITAGAYEAVAVTALYGTVGKGSYSSSTLVEIDQETGEILRFIGQVGHTVNGLAWDPTTGTLYGSTRESDTESITSGNHDGGYASTILIDSSQDFIGAGVEVGMQIQNHTQGTWGTITALSTTTITAPLMGAPDIHWDHGDSYTVYDLMYNGLITIDLATGEGTPVGAQGWGLSPNTSIRNIAVNSSGHMYAMYGGYGDVDDLVIIDKSTGIATVIGSSGIDAYSDGLAFTSGNALYLVNHDGRYYYMNTSTGAASNHGDIEPGVDEPLHHGVFDPHTDRYYGLRNNGLGNDPYPWYTSSTRLMRARLASNSIELDVPTAFGLHTLAFVDLPGLVDLDLEYDGVDNEMTMTLTVGTEVPAVMLIKLFIWNQVYYLANVTLPPIDPRESNDFTVSFPRVGEVGVLVTLLTQDGGIAHSAWETVDTGF